ncbi:MAG: hypothetical protein IT260_09320 [Saprospiraceae bacterium]|nr:hypothetical protein [Saprospiraceae bacterium]
MAKRRNPRMGELSTNAFVTGEFSIVANLNEIDRELLDMNQKGSSPIASLVANDDLNARVLDANGALVQTFNLTISSISQRILEFPKTAQLPLPGEYSIEFVVERTGMAPLVLRQVGIEIQDRMNMPRPVSLEPTRLENTEDESLWQAILRTQVDFRSVEEFVNLVLSFTNVQKGIGDTGKVVAVDGDRRRSFRNRLPFVNVDEYALVKYSIDAYMRRALQVDEAGAYFGGGNRLPYYQSLSESLDEIIADYLPPEVQGSRVTSSGSKWENRLARRTLEFPAIELLWSYWMQMAMLPPAMRAVSMRFQNVKGPNEMEPLLRFDTSPLRPLSNMLWGYIQDEQHRTTAMRLEYECQHAYNLVFTPKALARLRGVDNRSNFLEAFHNLLHYASIFFKDYDDMTRRADGFPLLTALREVHLLLAEGNHNAYYNMTYTARHEMLTMQYLLARPEMRLFLGGRPMVPYPENWMDRLDTMKSLQGWDSTSVLHYYDLASAGERLLLGVRYGDWTQSAFNADDAGNWAVAFRNEVMRYINAYRVVTGVDLSADAVRLHPKERAIQPYMLVQRRLQPGNGGEDLIEIGMPKRAPVRRF